MKKQWKTVYLDTQAELPPRVREFGEVHHKCINYKMNMLDKLDNPGWGAVQVAHGAEKLESLIATMCRPWMSLKEFQSSLEGEFTSVGFAVAIVFSSSIELFSALSV